MAGECGELGRWFDGDEKVVVAGGRELEIAEFAAMHGNYIGEP